MSRVKTFDSTGVAPNGKLFAGDLNAIEDQYADAFNLLQAFGAASIAIGETGLQIVRFGSGEARLTGAFRTDGITRALGGLYFGAFTTAQRDALSSANAPYGLTILNTSTNRLEINLNNSGGAPSWQSLAGSTVARGTFSAIPAPALSNSNTFYFATDQNGGTLYYSDGSSWTKIAPGITEQKVPLDGSVSTPKLADGSVTPAKAAPGAFAGQAFDTVFPTTNLFNGYRFTLFVANPGGGWVSWDFIYRADLDSTYPWHFLGGAPMHVDAGVASTGSTTFVNVGPSIAAPRNGIYTARFDVSRAAGTQFNGTTAIVQVVMAGVAKGTINGGFDVQTGGSLTAQQAMTAGQTATYNLETSDPSGTGVNVQDRSIDMIPQKVA